MRAFFLLLVLANLAFFAWDRYLRTPLSAGERIEQVQITPEKIRLVNTRVPPATPAAVCMEWGAFAGAAVARADAALEELALPAAQVTRVVTDASGYWVYIAPLKSKGDVDKAGRALKGFGVDTPLRRALLRTLAPAVP